MVTDIGNHNKRKKDGDPKIPFSIARNYCLEVDAGADLASAGATEIGAASAGDHAGA